MVNLSPSTPAEKASVAPDYWELTRQPLPTAVFLLPLLLIYEFGVMWLSQAGELAARNGADHWIREGLLSVGFHQTHLVPTLILLALGVWHFLGKYPHKISGELLTGMLAESLLFAVLLVVIGQTQDILFHQWSTPETLAIISQHTASTAVSYIGAGIYEEVLFRGILCTLLYLGARSLRIPISASLGATMILSSVLFAGAHYVGPAADQYTHFSFLFRACAGLYFAGLFFCRGLGIAIGAHTVYDLLVGIALPALLALN